MKLALRQYTFMRRLILSVIVLGLAWQARPAAAVPLIEAGDHVLYANTPGQPIHIFVSRGDAVQRVLLTVQITDGGPDAGGNPEAPAIESVDLLTGTIFSGNNVGQLDQNAGLGTFTQFWQATTLTDEGTVTADGLLATILVDTTGFGVDDGPWELRLSDIVAGDTEFGEINASITNGMITIHPVALPWHNADFAEDIDNDGELIPRDALRVIFALNNGMGGLLPFPEPGTEPPPFLDPSGDNYLSPRDALLVITALNDLVANPPMAGVSSGLSDSSVASVPEPATLPLAVLAMLAAWPLVRRRQ